MQDNYRELTMHSTPNPETPRRGTRKPRVHWTALEWEQVVTEYVRREDAGEFETGRRYDLAGKIRLCQVVLPPERRCNDSRFYHENFKREIEHHLKSARDRILARREMEAHKARGERNAAQIISDMEAKITGLEDMGDELARELRIVQSMQREILDSQTRMLHMLSVLAGEPEPPASVATPTGPEQSAAHGAMLASETGADGIGRGPRIDVVGLLDAQAARLSRMLQGKVQANLRFIRSDDFHTVGKFAHHVVLCTDFSPKNAQGVLRSAGCKILFVSGNVSAIVRAMESRYGNDQ